MDDFELYFSAFASTLCSLEAFVVETSKLLELIGLDVGFAFSVSIASVELIDEVGVDVSSSVLGLVGFVVGAWVLGSIGAGVGASVVAA